MMPGYSSSPALRVLIAGMQVAGCFVFVWPDCCRSTSSSRNRSKKYIRAANIGLCLWNAGVTLCLLAWLVFEIFFLVTSHKLLCIGELAHVVAVTLNVIALVVLPVLLLSRSKQLSVVLAGLEAIQNPHGPRYLSRVSQVLHGVMSLVTCGAISWAYVSFEVISGHWKPIFAFLNIFVVARVLLVTLLFRFLFHSLSWELVHATQIMDQEYGCDLTTTNDHRSCGHFKVSSRATDDFTTTQHKPDPTDHNHDHKSSYLSEHQNLSIVDIKVDKFITSTRNKSKTSNDHIYDYKGSKYVSRCPMTPNDDLKADNDFIDTTEHDGSTDHRLNESKSLYKNPKTCIEESEVDITCPVEEKVDNEVIGRWTDTGHLSAASCATGDHGDCLLHALAKLEEKIHVVSKRREKCRNESKKTEK